MDLSSLHPRHLALGSAVGAVLAVAAVVVADRLRRRLRTPGDGAQLALVTGAVVLLLWPLAWPPTGRGRLLIVGLGVLAGLFAAAAAAAGAASRLDALPSAGAGFVPLAGAALGLWSCLPDTEQAVATFGAVVVAGAVTVGWDAVRGEEGGRAVALAAPVLLAAGLVALGATAGRATVPRAPTIAATAVVAVAALGLLAVALVASAPAPRRLAVLGAALGPATVAVVVGRLGGVRVGVERAERVAAAGIVLAGLMAVAAGIGARRAITTGDRAE